LQLLEEESRIETQRESGAEHTATNIGNQARMLQSLGRYELAKVRYEQECQVSIRNDDILTQVHCLLGLASVAADTDSWDEAKGYLNRADPFLGADVPSDSPPMRVREVLQGRIDLAAGRLTEAEARIDRVLAHRDATTITFQADLSRAETALAQKDAARAAESARRALQWATSAQGNLPYSDQTGLASLMLGRALRELGDAAGTHQALAAAVLHLSNTVDPGHPALARATQLLATCCQR
jgi:tetratricopeptide (TPR) repeat protein